MQFRSTTPVLIVALSAAVAAMGCAADATAAEVSTARPSAPAASSPAATVAPEPLHDEVLHDALTALLRGDAHVLVAAGGDAVDLGGLFAVDGDPDRSRSWPATLMAALADPPALPPATVAEVTAALDGWYGERRALCPDGDARLALAARFLPAPAAVADLRAGAARAFDHGDLRGSLAIDALLPACARDATLAARDRAALDLIVAGATPDGGLAPPGLPLPVGAIAQAAALRIATDLRDAALTGRWLRNADGFCVCDPWNRMRWWRRTAPAATVVVGEGGAILRDGERSFFIDEDGQRTSLPVAADALPLAVAGGAAWFADGAEVERDDPASGLRTHVTLPATPLCAPLVRGERSLWLTAQEAVLVDIPTRPPEALPAQTHPAIIARFPHHLTLAGEVSLVVSAGDPVIVTADGAWTIPPFARQLANAAPVPRACLLKMAGRWDDLRAFAASRPEILADAQARLGVLQACFHRGGDALDDADRIAATAQEHAWVAFARSADADPARAAAGVAALEGIVAAHPEVELPRKAADLVRDEEDWDQVLSGAAWDDLHAPARAWPADCARDRPLADAERPATAAMSAPATAAAPTIIVAVPATVAVGDTVAIDSDGVTMTVGLHAPDGRFRWRNRWPAAPYVSGSARNTHAGNDGFLLIGDSASRLIIVDPRSGDRLSAIDFTTVDVEPGLTHVLCADATAAAVAVLAPPVIQDHVVVADAAGHERSLALAHAARWMVRAPGRRVLIGFDKGGVLVDAAGTASPVDLPTLGRGKVTSDADGVWVGGVLYRWR